VIDRTAPPGAWLLRPLTAAHPSRRAIRTQKARTCGLAYAPPEPAATKAMRTRASRAGRRKLSGTQQAPPPRQPSATEPGRRQHAEPQQPRPAAPAKAWPRHRGTGNPPAEGAGRKLRPPPAEFPSRPQLLRYGNWQSAGRGRPSTARRRTYLRPPLGASSRAHGIDLASVTGAGVGGGSKQDITRAATARSRHDRTDAPVTALRRTSQHRRCCSAAITGAGDM